MKSWIVVLALLSTPLAGCGDNGPRNHAPTIDDLQVTFAGPLSWRVQLRASDVDADALTCSLALGERPAGPFVTLGDERRPLLAGQHTTLRFDDEGAPLAYLRVEVSDLGRARDARIVPLVGATYLYYWDAPAQRLRAYSADEDACALTLVDTLEGPRYVGRGGLGADPLGRFIYLSDASAQAIRSHAIDARDGSLAAPVSSSHGGSRTVAPGPFAATEQHVFMATTPWRCCGHGSLHSFVLDPASGALRELPSFCELIDPGVVVLDAAGRHLYAAGSPSSLDVVEQLVTYRAADDGSMQARFTQTLSGHASSGVRGGAALFVAVDARLHMWHIDAETGRPTSVGGVGPFASAVATDPLGRRLALLGEELALYAVQAPSLALRLEDSLPVSGVRQRSRLALSPSARLLVFDNGAGDVRLFRWNVRDARLDACASPLGGYDSVLPWPNEFVFVRIGRAEPR